jgi:uncharacterized membrane-anchored protein
MRKLPHVTLLFWVLKIVLTRPLGATVGDFLGKPRDHGGLAWGTVWTSATLLTVLVMLITYKAVHVRRRPLSPLPAPVHRRTGEPQHPNGELITQPA